MFSYYGCIKVDVIQDVIYKHKDVHREIYFYNNLCQIKQIKISNLSL